MAGRRARHQRTRDSTAHRAIWPGSPELRPAPCPKRAAYAAPALYRHHRQVPRRAATAYPHADAGEERQRRHDKSHRGGSGTRQCANADLWARVRVMRRKLQAQWFSIRSYSFCEPSHGAGDLWRGQERRATRTMRTRAKARRAHTTALFALRGSKRASFAKLVSLAKRKLGQRTAPRKPPPSRPSARLYLPNCAV